MVLNPLNNNSRRAVKTSCKFTCLYMCTFLTLLFSTGKFYQLGKFENVPLVLALILAEVAKFCLNFIWYDLNFGSKDFSKCAKIKKCCQRLKLKEVLKCGFLFTCGTAVCYILAVLFGAPLFAAFEETVLFSVLVCGLTILPLCVNLGANATVSLLVNLKRSASSPLSELLVKNFQLTLLGAWLGAVVIPLDWDRPWQMWPIPCSIGALFGYTFSHGVTLIDFKIL